MNLMNYKGYRARIEYSDDDDCLIGRLIGIQDVIGFHGDSVDAMRAAFQEAVDDYLAACAKAGKAPEKPASGKVLLRLPPEVHAAAIASAQAHGKSLNQWAADVIAAAGQK